MADASNTKIVRCCHCRGMLKVAARALSVSCPHCNTRVTLEDLRIVGSHPGKRLATSGNVLVEATARLQLDLVGNHVLIHGRVKGAVQAGESVEIGPTGQVVGDIKAPKLVIRDGGSMQGRFERIATNQGDAGPAQAPTRPTSAGVAEDSQPIKSQPVTIDAPAIGPARPLPLRPPASK